MSIRFRAPAAGVRFALRGRLLRFVLGSFFLFFSVHLSKQSFLFHSQLREGSLELERLIDILPVSEEGDDLVALRRAERSLAGFKIELGQFERPLVPEVLLREFLEDSYPLVDAHILHLIELVLQDVSVRVPGSHVDVLAVQLQGSHIISQFQLQLAQGKYDLPPIGALGISQFQDSLAVVISSVYFIYVADLAECPDILDPAPVHRISNLGRFLKAALQNQRVNLADRNFKFIFIQL